MRVIGRVREKLTKFSVVYRKMCCFSAQLGRFANVYQFHEQPLPIFTGLINGLCQSLPLFCTLPIFTVCQTLPVVRYIVWCSSCGQNFIQFATPCRPSASTVCLTCTFAEPQNSLPKNGHEHYHDSLNIAYIISHVNTEFLDCFMGGLPALGTFPRFACPQIIPHKLAFSRLAHLCTPCTDHPCSNCSENLPGCSFQCLLSK
jgi:hypothetical protein